MSSFCLGLKGYVGISQMILVGEGQSRQREQQNHRGEKAHQVWLVVLCGQSVGGWEVARSCS